MSEGITVSKEFGVNPSVLHCECCGKDYGLAMFGTGYKDPETGKTAKAPKDILHGFCNDCQKVIDEGGVMIVEVADGEGEKNPKNPYRTGRIVGCSKQYKERNKITTPMIYMEQSMFQAIFDKVEFK